MGLRVFTAPNTTKGSAGFQPVESRASSPRHTVLFQALLTLAAFSLTWSSACRSPEGTSLRASRRPPRSLYRPLPPTPVHAPAQSVSREVPASTAAWSPRNGRISKRWSTIVVHHSATERGSAATFDKFHRDKGWDELGYHFVIGNGTETPDGAVEVGSRWRSQKHGAHCKTPNQYFNQHGIGICLVGDFTKHRPTRRQIESLTHLVAYLCNVCDIPPGRVTTHGAVNPKTQCPGGHFSLASLKRRLGGATTTSSAR